ncbi:hypothetical protein [Verrucomicrobium spinosum]|uniref:hypothetical protein n=1 Tax=Verrucomicrobium spinosum TaxID=2736 RepID=UPI0021096862|nr:hypothetical protein [Verrucomicrobium spinosum]
MLQFIFIKAAPAAVSNFKAGQEPQLKMAIFDFTVPSSSYSGLSDADEELMVQLLMF